MKSKGQEEMIGFVLIVVLVAIIGIVFLSISLRTSDSNVGSNSDRLGSLISSLSQMTSACEIPESHFQDISDLVRQCGSGKICSVCEGRVCGTTKSACEVLRNTLKEAMEASFVVGEGSFTKYYILKLHYIEGDDLIPPVINGNSESCPGRKLVNERAFGEVTMYVEVCFLNS